MTDMSALRASDEHTPAPWGFGDTARHDRLILGRGGTGRYVCHVTVEQVGGGIVARSMEAEREANALLIVAAPEMLEALREASEQLSKFWSDPAARAANDKVRAVLAKAVSQ